MSEVELKVQAEVKRRSSTSSLDGKMASKNTTAILKALRSAMKNLKHVSEALQAYIIPSEDAHAVSCTRQHFIFG